VIQLIRTSRFIQLFYAAWLFGTVGILTLLAPCILIAGALLVISAVALARNPNDALIVAAREDRLPRSFGPAARMPGHRSMSFLAGAIGLVWLAFGVLMLA
jgi:hypothetical protein